MTLRRQMGPPLRHRQRHGLPHRDCRTLLQQYGADADVSARRQTFGFDSFIVTAIYAIYAIANLVVLFAASGGARMQEGMFSLMQMAKTSAELARLRGAGIPYISILTDATTGDVSASLRMLGDNNIGEPKALIGFAGPRVIEQTMRETLPEDFQRSEFLVEHGALDLIINGREMRDRLASLIALLTRQPRAA